MVVLRAWRLPADRDVCDSRLAWAARISADPGIDKITRQTLVSHPK